MAPNHAEDLRDKSSAPATQRGPSLSLLPSSSPNLSTKSLPSAPSADAGIERDGPENRKGTLQSIFSVIKDTVAVVRESFGIAYQAAPSLTRYRVGFAIAQASQVLVYGGLTRLLIYGIQHADSIADAKVLLPIAGAAALKYLTDMAQSRSQSAAELQQANIDALTQERLRNLAPLSLERLNRPDISKDFKLVSWGGIWGLTGASSNIIQGAGTAASIGISTAFIAAYAPFWITGLVCASVLYPAYKTWSLASRITEHERGISEKRVRASEIGYGRTWPHMSRLIRVLGIQAEIDEQVKEKRAEIVGAETQLATTKNRFNDVGHLLNAATGVALGLTLVNEVIKKTLATENALFLMTMALPIFQSSLEAFSLAVFSAIKARPALDAMRRLEKWKEEECPVKSGITVDWSALAASITVKDLHFAYPVKTAGERMVPVLKDVNLTIEPGTLVAIVGDNGAGKSTLMQLLDRAYEPIAGQLLVNNCPVTDMSDSELYRGMRVLPQYAQMMQGFTVRELLSWGRRASGLADNEELLNKIMSALGAAEIFSTEVELEDGTKVKKFPQGLDTKMGASSGGVDFSGGEMAVLYLTYMLYGEPKILCLDEPEKALSQERQKKAYQALFNIEALLGYKPTILLVTQNLEKLSHSERATVLFIDKETSGIGGYGKHRELLERCPEYAAWFKRSTEESTTDT